jgi:hypothetical protein
MTSPQDQIMKAIQEMREARENGDVLVLLLGTDRLCEALEILKNALAFECYCTGESDYDGKDILCDACEAVAKAAKVLSSGEGNGT